MRQSHCTRGPGDCRNPGPFQLASDRITSDVTTAGAVTLWSASYQYNAAGRVDTKTTATTGQPMLASDLLDESTG